MGIALGGLALADPVVANHSMTFTAVMAGTIIGSQGILELRWSNTIGLDNYGTSFYSKFSKRW